MPEIVVTETDLDAAWVTETDLDGAPDCVDLVQVCQAASDLMFVLSGYQFGSRTETVRPYRMASSCGCGGVLPSHTSSPFGWSTWSGWWGYGCACTGPSFVTLPGPVTDIDEVYVDGVLLAADDYRLYDGIFLVRSEGNWPCCQDLRVPPTEDGTWSIKFTHGPGIPAGGRIAALALAQELAKAAAGMPCGFSGRVQSITRDGVSAVVVDNQGFLADGLTGLTVPDLWILSVNPNGRNRGGTITRPYTPLRGLLGQVTVVPAT